MYAATHDGVSDDDGRVDALRRHPLAVLPRIQPIHEKPTIMVATAPTIAPRLPV